MDTIWVGIDPQEHKTRILVMAGHDRVLMKALLDPLPSSRAAVGAFLEALALWQGRSLRVALVAGGRAGSVRELFAHDCLGVRTHPLYTLEFVASLRPPRLRDELRGMGAFDDLRQLLLFEALR